MKTLTSENEIQIHDLDTTTISTQVLVDFTQCTDEGDTNVPNYPIRYSTLADYAEEHYSFDCDSIFFVKENLLEIVSGWLNKYLLEA